MNDHNEDLNQPDEGVDLVALFLSIITVSVLWYVVKKAFPNEVRDLQFFLCFVGTIVPFVMLICFGLAVINYDTVGTWSGWPPTLPLKDRLSLLIVCAVAFYIGQTAWLWWGWRRSRN